MRGQLLLVVFVASMLSGAFWVIGEPYWLLLGIFAGVVELIPVVGPMDLLKETRANHLGKLAFRWIYWNVLLPGRPVPLPALMTMAGKHVPSEPDK